MRALLACGGVAVAFTVACTFGRQTPDAPEWWAPTYAVVDDPCGLAVHGYQAAFVVDDDDDGAEGDTWWVYSDWDLVRDDVAGDTTGDGWHCVVADGFGCVPRRVGRVGGDDVIGWLDGDVATRDELSGTLELTWGACVSALDVSIVRVPWIGEGLPIEPDESACDELADDPGEPGVAEDTVLVVYPASPPATVHIDGAQVGEGQYVAWQIAAGPGDVLVVRDEQGDCIDAWRVEHPEQVLVVGGPP